MEGEVLKKVANGLNELGVKWAVGSSVLLSFYNLVEEPNDIDILIDSKDADKVKKLMNKLGEKVEVQSRYPFLTKEFFSYIVNNTEVEFMGNFSIDQGDDGVYEFILDDKAIIEEIDVDGVKVKATSLEDWIVAYMVMNDPKRRVPLIKDYFETMGIENRELLERNLKGNLPREIRDEIINLLDIV